MNQSLLYIVFFMILNLNPTQMKVIEVEKLNFSTASPGLDEISLSLDRNIKKEAVDVLNWNDFTYRPDVSFAIAYTDNEILLKYYVTEEYFKAEKTRSNEGVYEDSCVEFFVSPSDDGIYYNFEINGIGTILLGNGTERSNSRTVDPEIISKIRRKSSVGDKPVSERTGNFSWDITIAIPFEVFFRHEIKDLKGKTFRANFYKCGDKLTVPHYVTWNPINTPNPDYHRPEFFGLLKFK